MAPIKVLNWSYMDGNQYVFQVPNGLTCSSIAYRLSQGRWSGQNEYLNTVRDLMLAGF